MAIHAAAGATPRAAAGLLAAAGATCRHIASKSAIVCSAADSVLDWGALATMTPWRVAASLGGHGAGPLGADDDLSLEALAAVLKTSAGSLRVTLHRIRKALKSCVLETISGRVA